MSLHKLTAGSGYDYLTRQVAANDRTEGAYTGLASYYTDKGETPGVWVGSGMTHIDGLAAGDAVTAEQMHSLFGSGHHPLATQRAAHLLGDKSAPDSELKAATQLGAPYKVYAADVSAFRLEVAKRIEDLNASYGHPRDYPVSIEERAKVRTAVAVAFFHAEHGRAPDGPREIAATIAKYSRQKTTAVAGYDLTFSPVKSISTLWAIAPTDIAAQVELAHQDAVKDALKFVEDHVLYSREGPAGVRQVDVQGLVATAFTHRDSRAGDPDLHTHIAVANKVRTRSGKWLSIDGRLMFKAVVAASETYNTAIEKHLTDRLGVRFAERPNPDARKCPVREIVGVNPALNEAWSSRRASITARTGVLASQFQGAHGRPPTPVEAIQLAQQATLETRDAKHEPRTLAEQRAIWAVQARAVLGSDRAVGAMLRKTLHPGCDKKSTVHPDGQWIANTAADILRQVQARRSTWQVWHVRAEAHRQVRTTTVPTGQVEGLVEVLTDRVLTLHSLPVTTAQDAIREPAELRRVDGTSMYEVAGANLFTSADVIAAEERLLAAAGATTGRAVSPAALSLALLEQTANGATLNPGQVALVRGMATSGATLQLAIAPAGSGKTTAMRALTQAWTSDGGTVIGLAPSAAAAAQLREQTGARTDTLAKLVWSVQSGSAPDWVKNINDKTLLVIDEAGMADTLSLDAAVTYATSRGATVRLIGDDQQLAAIGAGGVLRDIATTHGALHLTQLMRFADPAEGAASLALREGDTAALGFYLDKGRVHVGDLATLTEDVFTSWAHDRAQGLDSIMLAPTRDLVSQLNQRAQTDRLTGAVPTRGAALSDGNQAYAGELVITRRNDRKLPTGRGDWVKNGDRWTVLKTTRGGALVVKHTRTGRTTTLPTEYVTASVELGYATTVHGAQGVSVDTMHGLAAPDQSRQQLYTMLTRGKVANHAYLQVVGDGDPHTVIRPENIHPDTATDLLEGILARDDSPRSVATLLREQADPATRLGHATARYTDALYVAAETTLGDDTIRDLDEGADGVVPGITAQPAWPTLRAHLILTAAHGGNPLTHLSAAAAVREVDTAGDTAAVLGWRLDDTGLRGAGPGPLPWVPAIPTTLRTDPTWGDYLSARSELVSSLAAEVAARATTQETPAWARQGAGRPADTVLAEVAVWRAANTIPDTDTRPTGPAQLAKAAVLYQRALGARVAGDHSPALAEWGDLIGATAPTTRGHDFTPVLAQRLAAISRAGLDARTLLMGATTATGGSLPDDHAASAIWWRISRHLTPAVAHDVDTDHHLTPAWTDPLTTALGTDRAAQVQNSPWWPTLVVAVEHALARGEQLTTITDMAIGLAGAADVDDAQALVWRLSVLADPPPLTEDPTTAPLDEAPEDAEDLEWFPPDDHETLHALPPQQWDGLRPSDTREDLPSAATTGHDRADIDVDADLAAAALGRSAMGVLEPSDADIEAMLDRAAAWDHTTTQPTRMTAVNAMAMSYYAAMVDTGWAGPYLDQRLTPAWRDNPHTPAGYAPPGWTHLLDHLRNRGVSDTELLETGLATTARTGRLIDRFRDRAVLPITHDGNILGFVGRRHPDATDDGTCGPKYLNTADTALFHKGAQLHGAAPTLLEAGAVPVLVEGPLDAYAVTLAGNGRYVGVAPLGTSMTGEQARQLATMHPRPVVATDADPAGRIAAERAYWLLTQHAADPKAIRLPDGTDPASLAASHGPEALRVALDSAHPLREDLIAERLTNLPSAQATAAAITVIVASPSTTWDAALEQLDAPTDQTRQQLHDAVTAFNRDPARAATAHLEKTREVRARLQAVHADPTRRWAALANELDPRLTTEADWPALANMLQEAHADGHDVHAITRAALAQKPLPQMPAQALRYRLITALPTQPPINEAQQPTSHPAAQERAAQWNFTPAAPRSTPTR